MDVHGLYLLGCYVVLGLSLPVLIALLFIKAPYGRHDEGRLARIGPKMSARLGWVLMESPSVLLIAVIFLIGPNSRSLVPLLFLVLWQVHYVQRTFIFPFLIRADGKKVPVLTVAMALAFNLVNAPINGYALGHGPVTPALDWLWDPRCLVGIALFVLGYGINRHSDALLRSLRKPGEGGYKIPRGGFYRWVSCPNYLGEIMEWIGFALATWTLAGAAFAAFTIANLAPRALSHHAWYRDRFPEYPSHRRALIP